MLIKYTFQLSCLYRYEINHTCPVPLYFTAHQKEHHTTTVHVTCQSKSENTICKLHLNHVHTINLSEKLFIMQCSRYVATSWADQEISLCLVVLVLYGTVVKHLQTQKFMQKKITRGNIMECVTLLCLIPHCLRPCDRSLHAIQLKSACDLWLIKIL